MSNFACEECGKIISDTPDGYITGCEHYPIYNSDLINMSKEEYKEKLSELQKLEHKRIIK